jgi:flagellar biosynthetic protein FliR
MLVGFMPTLFLTSVRVGVVLASLPAPFGSGAPLQIRVALGLLLSIALTASQWGTPSDVAFTPVALASAGIGEVMVGGVIGLTVRVTLAAAELAGNLIGVSMGQGFASSVDPTYGEETLPTGRLLSSLAALIFFGIQGHHVVLQALSLSLVRAPLGHAVDAAIYAGVLQTGSELVAHGLRIASPMMATMLVVQVGLGFVARSAQRVQVFSLAFAVTTSVGMLVLFVAMPSIGVALTRMIEQLPSLLLAALGG